MRVVPGPDLDRPAIVQAASIREILYTRQGSQSQFRALQCVAQIQDGGGVTAE